MQQEDAAVEKVSVSSFPNRATSIVCDYVDKQGLNGPVKSIQPHFRMLCLEAKKSHPFFVSCVKEVYNNVDWNFVEKRFSESGK
jgi:hypothetical protein